MEKQGRKQSVSLVGPVILIGLGTIFLLNNLGVLDWSVWEVIFRLWPILLVAAGLEILIGRRSVWGSLVALVLTLALVGGALWLFESGIVTRQDAATEEIVQALEGATRARVVIAPAVGSLRIEALPESARLVEGEVHLGSGERLRRAFVVEGETATFTLSSKGDFVPFAGGWGDEWVWDLGLNSDVPLELDISIGAGQSDVDLTGLTVSDLEVSMGVGQITVVLPDEGRFEVEIDGGIGEIIVVIPEGMAARIRMDTALVPRNLPAGYRQRDDVYTSPGYDSAENRVDLRVSLAIGNVSIRHSGGR